jgi:hypothetical protein
MSLGLKTLPDALALRPAPLFVARLLAVLFSRLPDILSVSKNEFNGSEVDVDVDVDVEIGADLAPM